MLMGYLPGLLWWKVPKYGIMWNQNLGVRDMTTQTMPLQIPITFMSYCWPLAQCCELQYFVCRLIEGKLKFHARIQPPGRFHAVYTPMKTMVIGGHFVCNSTLSKMVEIRSSLNASDHHTNADHHLLEQVLRRMLLKAVRVDQPQDCKRPILYLKVLKSILPRESEGYYSTPYDGFAATEICPIFSQAYWIQLQFPKWDKEWGGSM